MNFLKLKYLTISKKLKQPFNRLEGVAKVMDFSDEIFSL